MPLSLAILTCYYDSLTIAVPLLAQNFLEQQNSGEGHEAHKREVRKRYNMLLDLHVRESQKRLGSLVLQNTFSHAIVDNKIAMVVR